MIKKCYPYIRKVGVKMDGNNMNGYNGINNQNNDFNNISNEPVNLGNSMPNQK
ncbi:MAG: hypothetical protein L6V81_06730 [Clostridium sp.]|nr:MAG: hypothetical protein L6V81_06730 [Clostridium sp.]